jgi:hypothetical protein
MPHVKGHVAVDVMEDGRIVDHAEHDNYVSPFVYDALRKYVNAHFMMLHDGTNLYYQGSSFDHYALNSAFILTDYAEPANTRERVIHGTPLSYGYHQYVSNNANECSFNQDESYRKANSLRFVFDFSTSQGNGTFQSIYSGPSTYNPDYRAGYQLFAGYNVRWPVTYCDGKIYTPDTDMLIAFTVDDWITRLNGDTWNSVKTQVPNAGLGPSTGLTAYNHSVYWINGQSVCSAPVSDLTDVTTYNIGDHYQAISYSAIRDSFFICSSNTEVREYSTSFELKKTFPGNYDYSHSISAMPEENSVLIGNRVYDIDDNANVLKPCARWETSVPFRCMTFIGEFALAYGDVYTGLYLGTQYFSRARLDKPVTKNSRQTMKITYDFNMPQIDWEQ